MNKILSLLAIIILILTFSCDSAGSSSDSENPSETSAGVLASAGAVMGAGYPDPAPGSPPLVSPPVRLSAGSFTYFDGQGGTAVQTYSDPNTIEFDNFHAPYNDNIYLLNGLIAECTYSLTSNTVTASFTGDVTIEGGSLSGSYSVALTVSLTLSVSDSIVVTGSVTGTVNGESVNITINETIPAP